MNADEYATYLDSDRWAAIRDRAIHRDGYRCNVCGRTGRFEVHHRRYDRIGTYSEFNDVVTLCGSCHGLIHDTAAQLGNATGTRELREAEALIRDLRRRVAERGDEIMRIGDIVVGAVAWR
jgi:5-methylcytosine-specific restriction endonuclease McrA